MSRPIINYLSIHKIKQKFKHDEEFTTFFVQMPIVLFASSTYINEYVYQFAAIRRLPASPNNVKIQPKSNGRPGMGGGQVCSENELISDSIRATPKKRKWG